MALNAAILPVVTKDLPISPRFTPCEFLSRCKFRTLTTRQPMVEFNLLAYSRFLSATEEIKNTNYGDRNRTHDFRTNRCACYLPSTRLDHSGEEGDALESINNNDNDDIIVIPILV